MKVQLSLSFLVMVLMKGVSTCSYTFGEPFWKSPCGTKVASDPPAEGGNEVDVMKGIRHLKLQHERVLSNLRRHHFNDLYHGIGVYLSLDDYDDDWLPGRDDIFRIKQLKGRGKRAVVRNYPKLFTDLQKFAIAIEQLIRDETNEKICSVLFSTLNHIRLFLCEIETVIKQQPNLELPEPLDRSIYTIEERQCWKDETGKMVRDWKVMTKYEAFLKAWEVAFQRYI